MSLGETSSHLHFKEKSPVKTGAKNSLIMIIMIDGQGDPLAIVQDFKFDPTNKCYMYNTESVLEIETHKVLWDLEIQMDHLFSVRRPDLVIVNKKIEPTELWTLPFRLTTG